VNHVQPTLLMLSSLVLSATFASAEPRQVTREQITLRGKVEAVDTTARTVTIRGDRGNVVTLDLPKSADKLQVGDVVSVEYYDRVTLRPKPAGEPAVDRTDPPITTSTGTEPGALPGATVASQRVTTVTITGWDPATRIVTFTGPAGASYSRRLLDTAEAAVVAKLQVGDRVDVTRVEAVRVAVESRTSVGVQAMPEDFRHRLTISALWGPDNQFTGNMIKASTGQTTTGQTINLNETTYDDVYGRMTNFKIGIGYRTTPRSEAVFNFAVSRSSSETVTVGTVGTANTPLHVDFDDYNYWGFEAGQRFYFARVRFTPYVGYLVGLNRYDDIRGTFVDVPLSATPGLAAQDGKFFEKSWAFSFGPTGGILIGLGPFEIMGETQLRYMGGLSDVDWLIEEGLRDINDDSSRWSLPIQFGVRIRF
jgi:hypothetical protein